MTRAAMTQGQISRERKGVREAKKREILDALPKDLRKVAQDPTATEAEKKLA
jgi:hypothetical protein